MAVSTDDLRAAIPSLYPDNLNGEIDAARMRAGQRMVADAIDETIGKSYADEARVWAQVYANRADAVAAVSTLPAAVTRIAWYDGVVPTANLKVLGVTRATGATTLADMAGWIPLPPYNVKHWGIQTYAVPTNGTDATTALNAAMAWVEGDLIFDGWVKVTDKITVGSRCRPHVPEGRQYGGLVVLSDFNMSATCVVRPGTPGFEGATIGEFGIWFVQPSAPASRADLIQYPPAIDTGGITRGKIESLRISNAWDGIIGIGNWGGYEFGTIEIGCFNKWCNLDGALDFVRFGNWHIWLFGFAASTPLSTLYYATPPTGTIRRVDSLQCDSIQMFRAKLTLNDTSATARLPYQIDTIALDGDGATLTLGDGPSQIGRVYSTKSTSALGDDRDIVVEGIGHRIDDYVATSIADSSVVVGSGGNLTIGHANILHLNATRRAINVLSGGKLRIDDLYIRAHGATGAARSEAFAQQQAGGELSIGAVRPNVAVNANHPLVVYGGDSAGNYLDMSACPPSYTATFSSSWTLGYYKTIAGQSIRAQTFTGLNIDNGTEDGGNLVFHSAGHSDWSMDNRNGQLRFIREGTVPVGFTGTNFSVNLQVTGTAVTQSNIDVTTGRLTKVGDFGLGTNGSPPGCPDLDSPTLASGTYNVFSTTPNIASRPSGADQFATISVHRYDGNRSWQVWYNRKDGTGGLRMWVRSSDALGAWSAWEEILTSDMVTQSTTDTTSGRLLKVGDFGIGHDLPAPNDDADDCVIPGFNYRFSTGGLNTPLDNPYGSTLHVFEGNLPSRIQQMFVQASNGHPFFRGSVDGGATWSAWKSLVAIRGSTANGQWTRHADGTMECWHTQNSSSAGAATWTYPTDVPFVGSVNVQVTPGSTVPRLGTVATTATPTLTVDFRCFDSAGALTVTGCNLRATGRWY